MPNTPPPRPPEEIMWAGPSGDRWLANATLMEQMLRPIGDALLDHAQLKPGENVLDVGCGAGGMSLDIARRIAPNGSVTGLDISPALIAEATRRAASANTNARFVAADAARAEFPPPHFDALLSRFGSMFFSDPYVAFAHLHSLLNSSGRLALACWAPLIENPWMLEMRTLLQRHLEVPIPPPRTPGPFAFDQPDYLRDILTKAAFKDITFTPMKTEMPIGGPNSTPASAADFLLKALSMAQRALDAPEPLRSQFRAELTAHLHAFNTPTGIRMPASLWLVSAHA